MAGENGIKHICLSPGALTNGGIRTVFLTLAAAFIAKGHRVDILLTSAADLEGVHLPTGLNLIHAGRRTRSSLKEITSYLAREKPDAVISARPYIDIMMLMARALARHKNCRLIWTFHTHASSDYAASSLKMKLMTKLAFTLSSRVEHIVAVSDGVAQDLMAHFLPKNVAVKTIYNPLLLRKPVSLQTALHPWLEQDSDPVLISVGRLVPQKDHATLLDSFRLLLDQHPARLLILGDGPLKNTLVAQARSLGIANSVDFVGYQPDIAPYLQRATCLVMSSRWEGFGMVLVEALSLGCPIVATDCPAGPAEILENGRFGRLVPVGDAISMCEAIVAVLRAPVKPEIHQKTLTRLDPASIADAYLLLV